MSSLHFIVREEPVTLSEASKVNPIDKGESPAGIYPNPFSNSFTLLCKGIWEGKQTVSLFNLEGKLVLRKQHIESGQKIEVGTALKPGVYFLRVGTGKSRKFLK